MKDVSYPIIIKVQNDEEKEVCCHCENQLAMVQVYYERTYGIKKRFVIDLCMECYSHPDFQELKATYQNVKVRLL